MIEKFILWGHSLNDYKDMFGLKASDLERRIVEYGAGATSFNAEMHQLSHSVVSCDPMFRLPIDKLKAYVEKVFDDTVIEMKANEDKYHWKHYGDLQDLLAMRRQGIQRFFDDFDQGLNDKRYLVVEEGAPLPFDDFAFDLAFITHHLFVNFFDRGVKEHVKLIKEMVRIAGEVRIFPLLNRHGQVSQLLGPVMLELQQQHLGLEVRQVPSQLQKGGNAMLRVWAMQCDVTEK